MATKAQCAIMQVKGTWILEEWNKSLPREEAERLGSQLLPVPRTRRSLTLRGEDLVPGKEGASSEDLRELADLLGAGGPSREDIFQGQRT